MHAWEIIDDFIRIKFVLQISCSKFKIKDFAAVMIELNSIKRRGQSVFFAYLEELDVAFYLNSNLSFSTSR